MAGCCGMECERLAGNKTCGRPEHAVLYDAQRLRELTNEALHPTSPSPGHSEGCPCHRCRMYGEGLSLPSHVPPQPYLNCPYCPAQAYPSMTVRIWKDTTLVMYQCTCKHTFYTRPEESKNVVR